MHALVTPIAHLRGMAPVAAVAWVFALGLLTDVARAGTYQVTACFGAENNAWQTYRSDSHADAYVECPGGVFTDHATAGMIARNVFAGDQAPIFSNSRVYFDAPAGAAIVAFSAEAQINTGGGWQAGVHDDTHNQWLWCGSGCFSGDTWAAVNIGGLSTSRIQALLICGQSSCDQNGAQGKIALRKATVTIADSTAPSLAIGGPLASGAWQRGTQDVFIDAQDNVGIRSAKALVDGSDQSSRDQTCDQTRSVPCPDWAQGLAIETARIPDGRHTLTVRVTDSADNSAEQNETLLVDNSPPARPEEFVVAEGDAWRSQNRFEATWRNPVESGVSPIAAAEYELCPVDGGSCVRERRDGAGINRIDDLAVPQAGDWTLRLWLRDQAGNDSGGTSVGPVHLRFDDDPPQVAFLPPDEDHPTRIAVRASDEASGLAEGAIEIKRRGEITWRELPTTVTSSALTTEIDDEALPDGPYDLRARAVDQAGNERSTDHRVNGDHAEITLPVRIKARLVAGRVKHTRIRSKGHVLTRVSLLPRPRVPFGTRVRIRGRLTTPGRNPLPGAVVHIFQRPDLPGAPFTAIGSVESSRTGRFTYMAPPGSSRTLRFRYDGANLIRPRTFDVQLRVAAATSFGVSRHSVLNGEAVTFRGRVKGGPLPPSGKLVALQVLVRRHWRSFATVRATPADGRWQRRYRFQSTTGRIRYQFRALVPRESGYPYETGKSHRTSIVVRGL